MAVGDKEDMIRLCEAMLSHCDALPEEEFLPLGDRLEERIAQVNALSLREGGDGCGFYYGMLAPRTYGSAYHETGRLSIRLEKAGLWTALMTCESGVPFQQEDWLVLHNHAGKVPILLLYASENPELARGMAVFTGGEMYEDWSRMDECWLWLIRNYMEGYPPEEVPERLQRIRKKMRRENEDFSITALLKSCLSNLRTLSDTIGDGVALEADMAACRENRDFQGLFADQCLVGESRLWDAERLALHEACLGAVLQAWQER